MTKASYTQLAEWHKQHADSLEILLFPSDEFGGQEKPTPEIAPFVKGYGLPTDGDGCHLMAKVKTNGADADPIWQFAKTAHPGNVGWNFGAWFLFGKDGEPLGRWGGRELPALGAAIEEALQA